MQSKNLPVFLKYIFICEIFRKVSKNFLEVSVVGLTAMAFLLYPACYAGLSRVSEVQNDVEGVLAGLYG